MGYTEVPLVTVTSNATDIRFLFKGLADENGDLHGLKIYQAPNAPVTYDLAELKDGVTTLVVWGRKVISLRAPEFDSRLGGELIVSLLRDGIFNDRRDLHLDIQREGDGWALFIDEDFGRVRFDALYLKARTILGQPRGIGQIDIFRKGKHVFRTDTRDLADTP